MKDMLMTLTDVAHRLGKSRASVYRLISEGKLTPHYRPSRPRTPLFQEEEVNTLLVIGPREEVSNGKLHKSVKKRYGDQCVICASSYLVGAHHVVPIEQGGPDSEENMVALCRGCNTSIHGTAATLINKARKHGTTAIAIWLLQQAGHPPLSDDIFQVIDRRRKIYHTE